MVDSVRVLRWNIGVAEYDCALFDLLGAINDVGRTL